MHYVKVVAAVSTQSLHVITRLNVYDIATLISMFFKFDCAGPYPQQNPGYPPPQEGYPYPPQNPGYPPPYSGVNPPGRYIANITLFKLF